MSLAPVISPTGISAPSYADIVSELRADFQAIFGTDIYIDPDSQDGQLIAIWAAAQHDVNNAAIAAYNAYSPLTAQGVGLSSVVKINGISRLVATNSQVVVTLVGEAGTQIINGIVGDSLGLNTRWSLPPSVTIPPEGEIDVTATCTVAGSTSAAAGTITKIITPTRGWQSVTNSSEASPGEPIETDATLRQRQSVSTALPSLSVFDGTLAAIANISGVGRYRGYENNTNTTDGNGLPEHSISIVVSGGDVTTVAQTIANKKGPGCDTYGDTTVTVYDPLGIPSDINFFELSTIRIYVSITVKALPGFLSSTNDIIKAALAQFVSTQPIGEKLYYGRLWAPANLSGSAAVSSSGLSQTQLDALSATYDITVLQVGTSSSPSGTSDIPVPFNQAVVLSVGDIAISVT